MKMGVHNREVYPEIKRLLEIPEDEPIFIIRAQDKLAEQAVEEYGQLYRREVGQGGAKMNADQRVFRDALDETSDEIWAWQENNRDKVKLPD